MIDDEYEVLAIRYASWPKRFRWQNFHRGDPHDDAPMPLDFFVWAIRNDKRTIVVDTGYDATEAATRNQPITHEPREALAMAGIDCATVEDVVITHLHFDHAGSTGHFPKARFHLQEREMVFATGPCMCHDGMAAAYTVDHVCAMVKNVFERRVQFHDGAEELAPGVSVHLVGGHTGGIQCVRVKTRRGWVVLASDVSHYYENFETGRAFPLYHDMDLTYRGYAALRKLASSPRHIIPGHDPLVMARYPAVSKDLEGIAVRLDVMPKD